MRAGSMVMGRPNWSAAAWRGTRRASLTRNWFDGGWFVVGTDCSLCGLHVDFNGDDDRPVMQSCEPSLGLVCCRMQTSIMVVFVTECMYQSVVV